MTDHPANGRPGLRSLLSRWGVPVSVAVFAGALTVAGCAAPADPPAPVADATTAPPDCAPEQAALVLDPPTRQDVLTRVESRVTWQGADLSLGLARSWYATISGERNRGGGSDDLQVYSGLSWLF